MKLNSKVKLLAEAIIKVGEKIICVAMEINLIYSIDLLTQKIELLGYIPDEAISAERLCGSICYYKSKLVFIPYNATKIWVYDTDKKNWSGLSLAKEYIMGKFYKSFVYKNYVFMIPSNYDAFVRINMETGQVDEYSDILSNLGKEDGYFFSDYVIEDNNLMIASCSSNSVVNIDLNNMSYEIRYVGKSDNHFVGMAKKGNFYWLIPRRHSSIVKWDGKKTTEISIGEKYSDTYNFLGAVIYKDAVLVPGISQNQTIRICDDFEVEYLEDCGYTFAGWVNNKCMVEYFKNGILRIHENGKDMEYRVILPWREIRNFIENHGKDINNIIKKQVHKESDFFELETFINIIIY